MRPKKVLLIVSADPQYLSELTFLFVIHGYRVIEAPSAERAVQEFSMERVDMVLAEHELPVTSGSELGERLKKINSHVPVVLIGDMKKMQGINSSAYRADATIDKVTINSAELLERVKVWSARKRGPKRGVTRVEAPALAMAAGD